MNRTNGWLVTVCALSVAACSTSPGGGDAGHGNDAQSVGDGGGTPDVGAGNDGGGGGGFTCSTGTLYAGNPVFGGDPGSRPTSGTGILADPPLQWQTLVFAGAHLYTRQESEVWSVDISAASPVETRIAGMTPSGSTYDFSVGPCSSASFSQLRGLAALSDGSLVASDYFANAVVHITHPDDPATCNVSVLAGTAGPILGLDPSDSTTLPTPGNADGNGTSATFNFGGPGAALGVDPAGNVYVVDHRVSDGATLVRKITSGGDVTTLATLGTDPGAPMTIGNFTTIGSSLFAAARDTTNSSYVIRIDTTSGAVTTILGGSSDVFPPVGSGSDPEVDGITTDGTNLIVAGDGYVWYLTLAGELTLLAGTGNSIDFFPSGYDPTVSHPAAELALPTAGGSADEDATSAFNQIAFHAGAIYYRGFANGPSAFVERIACP